MVNIPFTLTITFGGDSGGSGFAYAKSVESTPTDMQAAAKWYYIPGLEKAHLTAELINPPSLPINTVCGIPLSQVMALGDKIYRESVVLPYPERMALVGWRGEHCLSCEQILMQNMGVYLSAYGQSALGSSSRV